MHPLSDISTSAVEALIVPLPGQFRPPHLLRPPDPARLDIQWQHLTPEETNLVKEFLATVRKSPAGVRIRVDAKLALALLVALNWKNTRKLNINSAVYYAGEMFHGRWYETNDAICLNIDLTRLANGQHRLIGICLSKKAQNVTFRTVTKEAEMVMDQPMVRSMATVTDLTDQICSAIRHMNEQYTGYKGKKLSPLVIGNIHHAYQTSLGFVFGFHHLPKIGAITGTLAFCLGQFDKYPTQKPRMERFIEQVAEGINLSASDPAYDLRRTLKLGLAEKIKIRSIKDRTNVFRLIIRAAYKHVRNTTKTVDTDTAINWFKSLDAEKAKVFFSGLKPSSLKI